MDVQRRVERHLTTWGVALVCASLAAWAAPLALRHARPAFLNFGPNDQDYVTNFRSDWEPEGRTRFHWTDVRAHVELPIHVSGAGHVVRLRARRHFLEPAHVTLRAEGRVVARFDIQADPRVAWRVLEFPLPPLDGRQPFRLDIDAPSSNPRPLGLALDWMELGRTGPQARFDLLPRTRLLFGLVVGALVAALGLAGWRPAWTAVSAVVLIGVGILGAAQDVLAFERIVREGAGTFAVVAGLSVVAVRLPFSRRVLRLDDPRAWTAGLLVALVLGALALRLVLLLHPQFYYPDVRVHAVFARELAKTGLAAFLRDFTANQYRFSLGLQFEHGHWYAFPYPPAFYALCWPLLRWARMSPEVAVASLAAVINSLELLLVFALARRLSSRHGLALLAAGAAPLLPIFITRLSLAYFPALVGHAVDAVVVLYLLSRLGRLREPRVVLTLGALVATALLTYTQSLLNWGLLLPVFLGAWLVADRSRAARPRQLGLAAAGVLGALLSLAFYGRYVPIVLDMQRGIPMPEERVLEEKRELARRAQATQASPVQDEEPDDPFAGPGLDLWRGTRKAAWRLFLFYGVFAPAILVGIGLCWRRAPDDDSRRFVIVWGSSYLLLNLASGGLPGPNLVRYNKDLEIVAPLFCVALAHVTTALWDRWRPAAVLFGVAFQVFGARRAFLALTDKFFAIR